MMLHDHKKETSKANFACWVIFLCFCCLLLTFFLNKLSGTPLVSKGLDLIQDRHSGSPNLGPNCTCMQRLSADKKSADEKSPS